MGIIEATDTSCLLCSTETECTQHLFLQCTYSRQIWNWWLDLWGVKWALPHTIRDLYDQWSFPKGGGFFKKVWAASFFVICWTIWKERNLRIFESKAATLDTIQSLILARISWWIKGWGDPFPYSQDEILRNPSCLLWNCSPKKPKLANLETGGIWIPPPIGWQKWNVDASVDLAKLQVSIGGVQRNS